MAALAAQANIFQVGGGGVKTYGPAHQADTFYGGALLFALDVHTTGKVSCVPTSGVTEKFLGICSKTQVIAAADDPVEFFSGGVWSFPAIATVAALEIGGWLVADKSGTISDNPADLVAVGDITPATGDCVIGQIVGRDSAGRIHVALAVGLNLTVTTLATQ